MKLIKYYKQAGAELCQAQVKLEIIVEIGVEEISCHRKKILVTGRNCCHRKKYARKEEKNFLSQENIFCHGKQFLLPTHPQGGWVKVEINAFSAQHSWNWA